MARGKPIPAEHQFPNPVKFSAVIDEKTRLNIEIEAGQLVPEFGYAPTQGQVIDYVFKKYLEK